MMRHRCRFSALLLVGLLPAGAVSAADAQSLTIKGSDTMVHLVSRWAEAFMTSHPNVEVSVTGGGSGTGVAALINGTTDICASSREMKDKEKRLAAQKKVVPVETVAAQDGLAIVVHPSNPISELTIEQIMKIYTGTYTRWNQVGGPDQPVLALSRESNSGTYVFFQEHVLQKQDYAASVRLMPASAAIVQAVADDRGAIGYVGLGYVVEGGAKIKVVRVKANAASAGVAPSVSTVIDGRYPVARPLYLTTNGAPVGAIKDFVEFVLSPEGQKIATEVGYVPTK